MAGKSSIPLLLGVGAAALLLGGKKKKKKSGVAGEKLYPKYMADDGDGERLLFDEECSAIINKANYDSHNAWITNRYSQLFKDGMTDPDQLTIQLLKDQSEHCPWNDRSEWTPLMEELYAQLFSAVTGWNTLEAQGQQEA